MVTKAFASEDQIRERSSIESTRLGLDEKLSPRTALAMQKFGASTLADFVVSRVSELLKNQKVGAQQLTLRLAEYLVPFWTQILAENPDAKLRIDDERQALYHANPATPININFGEGFVKSTLSTTISAYVNSPERERIVLSLLIKNFPELIEKTRESVSKIEGIHGKDKHIVFVSNHATLANLPLLTILLRAATDVQLTKIYTMVGPRVFAEMLTMAALRYTNYIKMWPPGTMNSETGFTGAGGVIRRSWEEITNLLARNKGVRLFVAPSGKRDKVIPKGIELGHYGPSEKLLSKLHETRGAILLPVGMNELNVFNQGGGVQGRGDIYLQFGQEGSTLDVLEQLPYLVFDEHEEPIGYWEHEEPIGHLASPNKS